MEFGTKYDVSIDEKGYAITFDPYNEGTVFQNAIERYKERTVHYSERVLVDRYTEQGQIVIIANCTEFVCQNQNSADLLIITKQAKSNEKTMPIE